MGTTDLLSWNDDKRERHIRKHGYDFESMGKIFDGRFQVVRPDRRLEYGEERFNMLVEYENRVVNVTFTMRGERYHLISARPASRLERKVFHEREAAERSRRR